MFAFPVFAASLVNPMALVQLCHIYDTLCFQSAPWFPKWCSSWGTAADWVAEPQSFRPTVCVFSLMIHQLVTQWQQSPKHLIICLHCRGRKRVSTLTFWGRGCKANFTSELYFTKRSVSIGPLSFCCSCFSRHSNQLLCDRPGKGLWQTVPVVPHPRPLTIICPTHHKHTVLTINTFLCCHSVTAGKVNWKHVRHSESHRIDDCRGGCNVSVCTHLQIWRWQARQRREIGRPTTCQWRPPWRRRLRERTVFLAGDNNYLNHVLGCLRDQSETVGCTCDVQRSESSRVCLYLPGCHLSVMTHPQSCRESLLSTLTEATPETLFKGTELSQGKDRTTQLWHIRLLLQSFYNPDCPWQSLN